MMLEFGPVLPLVWGPANISPHPSPSQVGSKDLRGNARQRKVGLLKGYPSLVVVPHEKDPGPWRLRGFLPTSLKATSCRYNPFHTHYHYLDQAAAITTTI